MTDKLRLEIEALKDLTRTELVERWRKAHGCLPPKGVKRHLLLHSAAWQLQARQLGGLKGEAKRTLQRMIIAGWPARSDGKGVGGNRKPVRHLRGKLAPGVRLVREWNGRLHVVEVVDEEFLYDGKPYSSLTAVAKRITGTNWSGPRFFGL
ncbi:MAG: DUF2924 domain-containing protein [Pseudomonadota bacterium]